MATQLFNHKGMSPPELYKAGQQFDSFEFNIYLKEEPIEVLKKTIKILPITSYKGIYIRKEPYHYGRMSILNQRLQLEGPLKTKKEVVSLNEMLEDKYYKEKRFDEELSEEECNKLWDELTSRIYPKSFMPSDKLKDYIVIAHSLSIEMNYKKFETDLKLQNSQNEETLNKLTTYLSSTDSDEFSNENELWNCIMRDC